MEKEMATPSSVLAWHISWTEESGGWQSVGSHRVRHDWARRRTEEKGKQPKHYIAGDRVLDSLLQSFLDSFHAQTHTHVSNRKAFVPMCSVSSFLPLIDVSQASFHFSKVQTSIWAFQVAHWDRIHLPMQETQEMRVWFPGREEPPEDEMATCSSILAWRTPRTEEPGGLESMGLQRVTYDSATEHSCKHPFMSLCRSLRIFILISLPEWWQCSPGLLFAMFLSFR